MHDAAQIFRQRLRALVERSAESQSEFARRAGIDRSTLSQVLSGKTDRLPRTDTLVHLAQRLDVSIDWLVGLSEHGSITPALLEYRELEARAAADAQLTAWHAEASGFKIRHAPTTLPDLLKTDAVLEYEFRPTPTQPIELERAKRQHRLLYQRQPDTDVEVVCPVQRLELFAEGRGVWSGLSRGARRTQLDHAIELVEELYPSFRWSLFDERLRICPPITVFGLQRAALYLGDAYLVFNSRDHIRAFAQRIDRMVRAALVEPTATAAYLKGLRKRI